MKICIDARNPSYGGTYTYVMSLLQALLSIDSPFEYLVIYDDVHGSLGIDGVKEIIAPGSSPARMVWWSTVALPRLLKAEQVGLYHSLKQPTVLRAPIASIYTFHSTVQYLMPELWKKQEYLFWRWAALWSGRRAHAVIAVSQVEKQNIITEMGLDADKVHVINLAPQPRFHPVVDRAVLDRTKSQFKLPDEFILFVGNINPFKNVANLVKAYHRLTRDAEIRHSLVLAGGNGHRANEVHALIKSLGLSQRVLHLGFVKEQLPALYSLASLFVFPSVYEAFCLPPLEAMGCGVPVVASHSGGVPEVVGEAAIRVDPFSVEEIAEAMRRVLRDGRLQEELRSKGQEHASRFTWERCAQETHSLYERVGDLTVKGVA